MSKFTVTVIKVTDTRILIVGTASHECQYPVRT